jgi:uncharacterized protein (TIGR03382 family)
MTMRWITMGLVVAFAFVLAPAGTARADVAPPEGTCEGRAPGDTCSEEYGCESGTCTRPGSGEEYICQIQCVEGTCEVCDDGDADVPADAGDDAGSDAGAIFTGIGGCSASGTRTSDVGIWLVAFAVVSFVILRRRPR